MVATTFHGDPSKHSEREYSEFTWEEIKKAPYPDGLNNDGTEKDKRNYASAYHRELRVETRGTDRKHHGRRDQV
jgi:hypothetical protein